MIFGLIFDIIINMVVRYERKILGIPVVNKIVPQGESVSIREKGRGANLTRTIFGQDKPGAWVEKTGTVAELTDHMRSIITNVPVHERNFVEKRTYRSGRFVKHTVRIF